MRERFGPLLKERVLTSKRNKRFIRQSPAPECWTYVSGSYHTSIIDSDPLYGFSPLELTGIEKGVYNRIIGLLPLKKDHPIVVLDIGSGLSISLSKIAKQLESEGQHLSAGRVILIGSNLSDTFPNLVEAERQILNEPKHVHTIIADVSELAKISFERESGDRFSLIGACDIIHESKALMHSHIPDSDLRIVAKLLTPRGVLLLRSLEQEIHPGQSSSKHYSIARIEAHNRGLMALGTEGSLFSILPPQLFGDGKETSEYGLYQKLSSAHEEEDVSYDDFR